jgi:hypothetical protein
VTFLRRHVRALAAASVGGLLLFGCSGNGGEQAAPDPAVTDADEVDGDEVDGGDETTPPEADDPDAEREPDEPSDVSTSDTAEPVVVDLDLEERTANGTVFRVHRLEVTELSILVDVQIIAAADTSRMSFDNIMSTPAVIADDLGNEYALIPPEGNSSLSVSGGEQLEGTLSYQGPLHRGVSELTLLFNQNSDPDSTNLNDRLYPHFTLGPIDITERDAS